MFTIKWINVNKISKDLILSLPVFLFPFILSKDSDIPDSYGMLTEKIVFKCECL
jgi:hypothetical protein